MIVKQKMNTKLIDRESENVNFPCIYFFCCNSHLAYEKFLSYINIRIDG